MDERNLQELEQLLSSIACPNKLGSVNILEATKVLKEKYLYKIQSCYWLVQILQSNQNENVRQLAAVEARKICVISWEGLDGQMKTEIRQKILQAVSVERIQNVKHSIARIIAEIAKLDLPNDDWVELPQILSALALSTNPSDREIGLYIIYCLCESLDDFFGDKLEQFFQLFKTTIQDADSHKVSVHTVLAIGQLSQIILKTDTKPIEMFHELLPLMVNVLNKSIEMKDENSARKIFGVFGDYFFAEPALINRNFPDLMQLMLNIAQSKNMDDEYRNMALSYLILAVRFKSKKIRSMKVAQRLVMALQEIAAENDKGSPDDDCPSRLAVRLIDIMSNSLPPKQVFEPLLASLPHYLSMPDPGFRKAALLAIGVAIEGASDYAANKLSLILPLVIKGLQDKEQQVQKAALVALTQLAEEMPSDIAEHHSSLMPLVFEKMTNGNVDICKSACGCLDVLIEVLDKDSMQNYLEILLKRFFDVINMPDVPKELRMNSISAVGSLAHASEEYFIPYFDSTVRALAPILELNGNDDELDLRAVAIDSIGSSIGAVNIENAAPHFDQIVSKVFEGFQTKHSRLRESCFCFFAISSRTFKESFGKYLEIIVPELLNVFKQSDFGNEVEELSKEDKLDEDSSIGYDSSNDGLGISTAVSLEKEIAAEALGELFTYCKNAFLPFLQDSTEALVNLTSNYHGTVRKAAIGSLWRFVTSLYYINNTDPWSPDQADKFQLNENVLNLASEVRKCALNLNYEEDEISCLTESFRSQAEAIKTCGPQLLGSDEQLKELSDCVVRVLKKQHDSQTEALNADSAGEEFEDESKADTDDIIEDSAEAESFLIDAACDVVVSISYVLGTSFSNLFTIFFPLINKYRTSTSTTERSMCIATLAENANALKNQVAPYASQLYDCFFQALQDDEIEVRSNAAYAIGILCESSGVDYSSQYMNILTEITKLFNDNTRNASDNAIGCISRMILANQNAVPIDRAIPAIIEKLPLKKDYLENDPLYRMIIRLYNSNNSTVLNCTEKLIPIFDSVLSPPNEQLKPTLRKELSELCSSIKTHYPQLMENYATLRSI